MPSTIQAEPPPVHWARKYSTEIGVGLIICAFLLFGIGIWSASRTSSLTPVPFSDRSTLQQWEGDIDASKLWQPYGNIKVKAGDIVKITPIGGKVTWDKRLPTIEATVGPEGAPKRPMDLLPQQIPTQFPMQDAFCASLIMRVGNKMYAVGDPKGTEIKIQEGGTLEFMTNTRYPWTYLNEGAFHFKVEIR